MGDNGAKGPCLHSPLWARRQVPQVGSPAEAACVEGPPWGKEAKSGCWGCWSSRGGWAGHSWMLSSPNTFLPTRLGPRTVPQPQGTACREMGGGLPSRSPWDHGRQGWTVPPFLRPVSSLHLRRAGAWSTLLALTVPRRPACVKGATEPGSSAPEPPLSKGHCTGMTQDLPVLPRSFLAVNPRQPGSARGCLSGRAHATQANPIPVPAGHDPGP